MVTVGYGKCSITHAYFTPVVAILSVSIWESIFVPLAIENFQKNFKDRFPLGWICWKLFIFDTDKKNCFLWVQECFCVYVVMFSVFLIILKTSDISDADHGRV